MKLHLLVTVTVGALAAVPSLSAAQSLAPPQDGEAFAKIPDQYICVLTKDVAASAVETVARNAVGRERGQVRRVYNRMLNGFAANISAAGVAKLQRDNPAIAYCEQDQEVRALGVVERIEPKARKGGGGGITAQADTVPWGITRVGGSVSYTGSARAWVIDSGIDLDHPDLNVDVGRSRSFITGSSSADDGNGHGTHVAGTIAGRANGFGVVGVAAGAPVVAVRVLASNGSGSTSGVIAGVDYVGANGRSGDVANMSLGGGISSALDQAVRNAAARGIRFTLAAGNEGQNANNSSPGRTNGSGIYTVSAFDSSGRFASFSNYGNPPVDVSEPGVSVYSTYRNGGYATLSGTSMAAPHAAGILLLGPIYRGGTVTGDRDSTPDPIGVR